jgi:hypothetical protein
MPYQSMEEVNPALKGIDPTPSLAQCNLIAKWADSIEAAGTAQSAWAAAIAMFKKKYHVEGGKWVPNKTTQSEDLTWMELNVLRMLVARYNEPTAEEMEEALRQLIQALEIAGFEVITSQDIQEGTEQAFGEVAYVVDLLSDLPQVDGKPDFSQPFRILPVGPIYRYGQRTVTLDDIALFEDNWRNRKTRGIRRERVAIDVEHEPGAIGYYTTIYGQGEDGLWAKIALTPRGRNVLAERDFFFFSPTVAWESTDVKTGKPIRNQIVGGALTNFPVLGDDTALPLAYSEAALHRMLAEGHDMSAYAVTKAGGDGKDYPASAWLIVEDPQKPTTWHLRFKEYVNGALTVTKNMCSKAAQALGPKGFRGQPVQLTASQRATAKSKLRSLYQNTLKVPKDEVPAHLFSERSDTMPQDPQNVLQQLAELVAKFTKGGDPTMSDQQDPTQEPITIDAETFSAMQTQLSELQAKVETLGKERDTYAQRLDASEQKLAEETSARQLVEMKSHVETFSHLALPVELAEDAPKEAMTAQEHFAWLQNADQAEGKPHWAFFNEVLKAANAALEEASVYTELGTTQGEQLTEDEKLHRAVMAYSKEHEVDYYTALKAVSGQPVAAA